MDKSVIHGTAVSFGGRALILTGPSGSGKSSLALNLMALGAGLICDDKVELFDVENSLWVRAPAKSPCLIEARGLGLLRADRAPPAPVAAELDLGTIEQDRLPPIRTTTHLGFAIPLLHKPESGALTAMLLQYLNHGVINPDDHQLSPAAETFDP